MVSPSDLKAILLEQIELDLCLIWCYIEFYKESAMKIYVSVVQEDPDNPGDAIITFPDEMIKELGWVEGDIVRWEILDNTTVVLSKVE